MAQKFPVAIDEGDVQGLVVAVVFTDVQHTHRVMRRALQHPQGILHALVGHRAVQGVEDVVGLGLAQVRQHDEAQGMLTVQVLKRGEHAVDVVVGFLAAAPGSRLDPGQHVDDDEAVATAGDVAPQLVQAAVVEQGKGIEQLELALGPDAGPDVIQAPLDTASAVFEGDVEYRLWLWNGKVSPDAAGRWRRTGRGRA